TATGGREYLQGLGVLLDGEAVRDELRWLEAAAVDESDDERPGCGGIAEASADGDVVVDEVIDNKLRDLAMPGDAEDKHRTATCRSPQRGLHGIGAASRLDHEVEAPLVGESGHELVHACRLGQASLRWT